MDQAARARAEALARRTYALLTGKTIRVENVEFYVGDNKMDDSPGGLFVVSAGARDKDIVRWGDERNIDPYWCLELVEPDPELKEMLSTLRGEMLEGQPGFWCYGVTVNLLEDERTFVFDATGLSLPDGSPLPLPNLKGERMPQTNSPDYCGHESLTMVGRETSEIEIYECDECGAMVHLTVTKIEPAPPVSKTYYRTTFKFVVLSEEPTSDLTVADMITGCDSGPMVGDTKDFVMESLTGKEMADALVEARSEPGFFDLDDDGNEVTEDGDEDGPSRCKHDRVAADCPDCSGE